MMRREWLLVLLAAVVVVLLFSGSSQSIGLGDSCDFRGEDRCLDADTWVRCASFGQITLMVDCRGDSAQCDVTTCTLPYVGGGVCAVGQSECVGNDKVRNCVNGQWGSPVSCASGLCGLGSCALPANVVCELGSSECASESVIRTCDVDTNPLRTFWVESECSNVPGSLVCVEGVDSATCNAVVVGDLNEDGRISREELGSLINGWKSGSVTRIQLGVGIGLWVNG